MSENILFRAIIEVLGKPEDYVKQSIDHFLDMLKKDQKYVVISSEVAPIQKQEDSEYWSVFAEVEIRVAKLDYIVAFCFDYMPSLIEVIEPNSFTLTDDSLSRFLSGLQAKLHHVDMLAKQLKLKNEHLEKNMAGLMKNYITVLLSKNSMTSLQLSKLTGVNQDKLEDFLDQLIDEGKIDLKGEEYFLKKYG